MDEQVNGTNANPPGSAGFYRSWLERILRTCTHYQDAGIAAQETLRDVASFAELALSVDAQRGDDEQRT